MPSVTIIFKIRKRREVFCLFFFPESMFSCCCSVTKSCPTPCDPIDCSRPDFPVLHYLLEFAQTHVHWVCDAIQPSHPLSPSSPALNLSQHQSLFQWVGSLHQVTKVLEFQRQYQEIKALLEGPLTVRFLLISYGPENLHMAINDIEKAVHDS